MIKKAQQSQKIVSTNENITTKLSDSYFVPVLMWGLATTFFAFQFIMRIMPGLVMPDLMQKFQINATSFGFFASLYYFGYAGMQIPMAWLLDKFGPRIIISSCAFICAIGTILLVYTNYWLAALICRFLIGASSAAGFLGTSKLTLLWFPTKLYARMIALNCTFGLMGALYAGRPMSTLVHKFGWETVLLGVGFIGLLMATIFSLLIRSPNHTAEALTDDIHILKNIKIVMTDKRFIIIAIANLLMVGTLEGFADVWGVSYLITTWEISKKDAASLTSLIFLGMIFGAPILAYIADKIKSAYKVVSATGFLLAIIFFIILSWNTNLYSWFLYVLLFLAGILCSYQVLVFSIGVSSVPPYLSSITVAFLNCVNMLGGSFFHGIIGYLMDFFHNNIIENSVPIYDVRTYTYALSIIPIAAMVGGIMVIYANNYKVSICKKNR